MKKTASKGSGHSGKQSGTSKHQAAKAKHAPQKQRKAAPVHAQPVHTVGAPAAKKRKLALGEAVSCCAAEALAASLRLAGHRVTDEDVLALYSCTASGADDGATILATLEAAAEYGLAGMHPAGWELHPSTPYFAGGILGLTLPGGEHAVTLDPSGAVWSWGELHPFPAVPAEEAWAVTWS